MKKLSMRLLMAVIVMGLMVPRINAAEPVPEAQTAPILQSWQQKFRSIGAPFPSLQNIKHYLGKWGAYEKRMWDCGRGNIPCSPEEIKQFKFWFLKRLIPILILIFYGIYRVDAPRRQQKEQKRKEEQREEILKLLQQRMFKVASDQINSLSALHGYSLKERLFRFAAPGSALEITWYQALNVPENASPENIRKKAKALIPRVHPDKGGMYPNLVGLINEAKNYGLQQAGEKPDKEGQYPYLAELIKKAPPYLVELTKKAQPYLVELIKKAQLKWLKTGEPPSTPLSEEDVD